MKKIIFIAAMTLFVLSGCNSETARTGWSESIGPIIVLNTEKGATKINVEIADTREERTKGLMYRGTLPANQGMFFIFDNEQKLTFWMKNTLISLDMVFFGSDYKVVKIIKDAIPCIADPCTFYYSEKPAQFVLEVNGGLADSIGLKEGDTAQLISGNAL